jgi:hypothetical protein
MTQPPSTTAPPSSSPAVKPILRQLLARWDLELTAVVRNPKETAADRTSAERTSLTKSFTSDSPYITTLSTLLKQGYIARDRGERPGPGGTVQTTTLLRITQRVDADHVSFVFCTYNDGVDFALSTGKAKSATIGIVQGTGEARRTVSGWRLYLLQQLSAVDRPAGTRNPCPALASR